MELRRISVQISLVLILLFRIDSFGSVAQFESQFLRMKSKVTAPLKLSKQLDKEELSSLIAVLHERSGSHNLDSQFLGWIRHLPEFSPVWEAVGHYARPRSSQGFDKRNRGNAVAVRSNQNLSKQREFFLTHRTLLKNLEKTFGVNAEVLVALCCTETRLSAARLPHLAYAVFATQLVYFKDAFAIRTTGGDSKRVARLRRSARHNLVSLFLYTMQSGVAASEVRSSWAGACGPMQFLPYNFHYLQDGDGDGKVEVQELGDSLAGAANFLFKRGWTQQHTTWFQTGSTDLELVKVLKRYNANTEYAKGVLHSARELRKRISASKKTVKTGQ